MKYIYLSLSLLLSLIFAGCSSSLSTSISLASYDNNKNTFRVADHEFRVLQKEVSLKSTKSARVSRTYTKYILDDDYCKVMIHIYNTATGRSYFKDNTSDLFSKCDLKKEKDGIRFYDCGPYTDYMIVQSSTGRASLNFYSLISINSERCFNKILGKSLAEKNKVEIKEQKQIEKENKDTKSEPNTFKEVIYDKDGYDKDGYDKEGFDWDGYDRNGYDRSGKHMSSKF